MKKPILLISAILIATLSSCSEKVYFTKNMMNELNSTGISPNKLQFYTDKQIILKKTSKDIGSNVNGGSVSINRNVIRNVIVLGTDLGNAMGICKEYSKDSLGLFFEEGEVDKKRLNFYCDENGRYVLTPKKKSVNYDGDIYDISQGLGSRLLIKKSDYTKYKTVTRSTKGLKVGS